MADSNLIPIKACANAVEAEHLRALLEEQGVPAFIDGANANTTLWHVGTALGGVRVLVRESDSEEAAKILEHRSPATGPWYCGTCQEALDASFDLCWSCGSLRSAVEQPFPHAKPQPRRKTEQDVDSEGAPAPDASDYDQSNPYASPRVSARVATRSEPQPDSAEETEFDEEVEAMLRRAWRASIIGLVFLPILLHLYSMYLLIRATYSSPTLSPLGQKLYFRTFAVNLFAGCFWGLIFRAMSG
jgi:hypothetical protein